MSEDAAVLLADFVSSLDNLPSEVNHILEEIGHKEGRVSDLRSRALQRDAALQKHARPPAQGGQGLLVVNPKEESSVKKIRTDLDNAEITTKEKVVLAERGVNLLSRHLNRLQAQLELLTSTVPPLPTLPSFSPVMPTPTPTAMYSAQPSYAATPGGTGAYNPYAQTYGAPTPGTPGYQDKRRTSGAAGTPMQVPLLPAQLASAQPGMPQGYFAQTPGGGAAGTPMPGGSSRRAGPSRLQNLAYASPGPAGSPGGHHLPSAAQQHAAQQQQQQLLGFQQQQQQMQQAQLRLAQQQAHAQAMQLQNQQQMMQQAQAQAAAQAAGNKRKRQEEEQKGREEESAEVEGEDLTPYCFCQRPSFGEMIGCDAPDCKIEWFHLNCIGLKESPEGSWYCSQCEPRMKQQGRARRK
ncbi:hypothetical protein JCM10213_003859 [Rhodosporidiobolus nylandii]